MPGASRRGKRWGGIISHVRRGRCLHGRFIERSERQGGPTDCDSAHIHNKAPPGHAHPSIRPLNPCIEDRAARTFRLRARLRRMRSRPMAFVTIFLLLSLVVVVVGTARPASGWLIKPMCWLCGWLCAWEDWVSGWITKRRHGWDAWMMVVVRMNSARRKKNKDRGAGTEQQARTGGIFCQGSTSP